MPASITKSVVYLKFWEISQCACFMEKGVILCLLVWTIHDGCICVLDQI